MTGRREQTSDRWAQAGSGRRTVALLVDVARLLLFVDHSLLFDGIVVDVSSVFVVTCDIQLLLPHPTLLWIVVVIVDSHYPSLPPEPKFVDSNHHHPLPLFL